MESTKTEVYASPAQWGVIQWLFHYPVVYLVWSDMYSTWINWSASWYNEAARQHMIATYSEIGLGMGDVVAQTKPRIKPLEGGTPRCTFRTFKALLRENIICRYSLTHYQLTPHVKRQLEVDELESLASILR